MPFLTIIYHVYCASFSVVPERKPSYSAVTDDMPSSSKPVTASAILTFVPDDEVKKIVTRPQVENSSNISADKQML